MTEIQKDEENQRLRQALCDVLTALGNGSGASPEASMEFLESVPSEVSAEVAILRRAAAPMPATGEPGASLAAREQEIVMLREACAAMVKYDDNDHEDGVQMMFEYNDAITKARAALTQYPSASARGRRARRHE